MNDTLTDATILMFAIDSHSLTEDKHLLRDMLQAVPRLASWTDSQGHTVGHYAAAHLAGLWERAMEMSYMPVEADGMDPILIKRVREIKTLYSVAGDLAPQWLEAGHSGDTIDSILSPVWAHPGMQEWKNKQQASAIRADVAPSAKRRMGTAKKM